MANNRYGVKKSPWETKSKDARNADSRIKFCKYCNMWWENVLLTNTGKGKDQIYHYVDFPSYGKQKEICFKCKGERNGKNVMDKSLM